jgi:hypothetical protein
MRRRRRAWVNNYEIYSIDGTPCVDFIGRFESLDADLLTAYRLRRDRKPWFMLALFGLATFFIGGEEISWFSRLFRYSVSAVEMSNEQHEMTVHNLKSFPNHLEAGRDPLNWR